MRKCVRLLFRVNLHVCVTSTRCSHDQWRCWSIPQMGGVQASEKTASLYVPLCLMHADRLSWPCRWTTFDLPCWPFSGGKGYWSQPSWLSHVLSPAAMKKRYVIQWVNVLHKHLLVTRNALWQLIGQSLCFPLYLSDGGDVCILCPAPPPDLHPWLLLISFVCDRPGTWWAERRHFLGREQRSIFPTCCCSIFNALHPSCSRKEWQ